MRDHKKLHLFPERVPQKFSLNIANAHIVRDQDMVRCRTANIGAVTYVYRDIKKLWCYTLDEGNYFRQYVSSWANIGVVLLYLCYLTSQLLSDGYTAQRR